MRLTPERASSVNSMPLKYPLVHEFVIVIADLYLPEDSAVAADAVPGSRTAGALGLRATPATRRLPPSLPRALPHCARLKARQVFYGWQPPCTWSRDLRACIWSSAVF